MSGFMNPAEFANIHAAEERFWWYRGMRKILFRMLDPLLPVRPPDRVLEAGCGTGYFSEMLQRERGWPMVALDLSAEGLRYACQHGVQRPVQADIGTLPFADESFDLTLSIDVMVHLPRGEESVAAHELSRVTRRGGLVVVRVGALDVLRSRHSEFIFERQRFTRSRLVRTMAKAGIRVLRCTYANSLLLPVAFAKFRIWEPLTHAPLGTGVEPAPPWLDRLLYAPLAAESAWIGSGRNLALGQSLILIGERIT
jgi:SAM-dependent methyltransferase